MISPRWARALVRLCARETHANDLLGDLEEVHRERLNRSGPWIAGLRTGADALGVAGGEVIRRVVLGLTGGWISGSEARLAARLLLRNPMMTLTSVIALSVGVALASTGFTAVNAILNPSLPFAGGENWVSITPIDADTRARRDVPATVLRAWIDGTKSLTHIGAYREGSANLRHPNGEIERLSIAHITPSTLQRLPFEARLGRTLVPDDAEAGAPPVVVVLESLWERAFDRDPNVVGRQIDLGGASRVVVGIIPDEAVFPSLAESWIPLRIEAAETGASATDASLSLIGYLAEGAEPAVATSELTALLVSRQAELGDLSTVDVRRIGEAAGATGPGALIVTVLIGLLLVVAGNVANLIIARTAARRGELAVRTSLGAPRGRLVAQLSFEVLVMAGLASALGLGASRMLLGRLSDPRTRDLPITMDLSLAPSTVLFVIAITFLATLVAGVWPALRATQADVGEALKGGGTGGTRAVFGWFDHGMIVAQITLSIGILGAAVMIHLSWLGTYDTIGESVPADEILAARITVEADLGGADADALQRRLVSAVGEVPQARAVAVASHLPGVDARLARFTLEDQGGLADVRAVPTAQVGPGFFRVIGIEARVGRLFSDDDFQAGMPSVAVVNETFADQHLGGANPLGRRFRRASPQGAEPGPWIEIIGVVSAPGLSAADEERSGGVFLPGVDPTDFFLMVRTAGSPTVIAPALREAAFGVHPGLAVSEDGVLKTRLDGLRRVYQWMGSIFTSLGGIVLLLSLVAMYAILAFEVTRRTREIGVRVALGADARRVLVPVLRRVAIYVVVGGALGTGLGLGLLAVVQETLVLRLPDAGPGTFPALALLTLVTGLIAAWVPARHALKIRPMDALRAE